MGDKLVWVGIDTASEFTLEALFGGGIEGERHGGSITLGGIWWEGRALRDVPRLKIEIWNNRPDGLFSM